MRDPFRAGRVIRYGAANAWADLKVIYTPLTWSVGWLGRIVLQVVFFASAGVLLHSPEQTRFLLIGNAVMATALEATMCIASTTWERNAGTLPLLVAAPTPLWPVFVGRSLQWLPSGVATASVALLAVGPVYGVTWSVPHAVAAVGCLVVVAVGTYCFALAVAAVVLAAPTIRNVVSNLTYTAMMLLCGVMVPVPFWPDWLRVLAQTIPLTHGLAAVRTLTGDTSMTTVAARCGLALAVGAAWLVAAGLLFERLARSGRRSGTIDFAA